MNLFNDVKQYFIPCYLLVMRQGSYSIDDDFFICSIPSFVSQEDGCICPLVLKQLQTRTLSDSDRLLEGFALISLH